MTPHDDKQEMDAELEKAADKWIHFNGHYRSTRQYTHSVLMDIFISGARWMAERKDAMERDLAVKENDERVYGDWEPLARKHGYTTFAGRNGFMDGYALAEKKVTKALQSKLDALKAAAGKLDNALEAGKSALAHEYCWSTGPMTGYPVADLMVCPGCTAIAAIDHSLTQYRATIEGMK